MGKSVSVRHVAALAANLPRGSKALAEVDPALGWTVEEHLLFGIANMLREEPQPYPWEEQAGKKYTAVEIDEYNRIMSLPRREA